MLRRRMITSPFGQSGLWVPSSGYSKVIANVEEEDDNKPVRPIWAVGALFRV
jgi:hypothetical protein